MSNIIEDIEAKLHGEDSIAKATTSKTEDLENTVLFNRENGHGISVATTRVAVSEDSRWIKNKEGQDTLKRKWNKQQGMTIKRGNW